MIDTKDIQPTDFVSIYKDIAEVIGIEATMKLHDNFQGQQLVLPKKLYTKDFIVKSIKQKAERGEEVNLRKTALQYGYTERWLRQMINDEKTKRNGDKLRAKQKCQKIWKANVRLQYILQQRQQQPPEHFQFQSLTPFLSQRHRLL